MTLGKYIQRLADKLDWRKQWEKRKALENIRKARTNQPTEPNQYTKKHISSQLSRYGIACWGTRRGRGKKSAQGQLLPRNAD